MALAERVELLQALAHQGESVHALLGVPEHDLDALARLGAAALVAKRHEQSITIFQALAVLEPANHLHLLHLAFACASAGDVRGTGEAVQRLLDHTSHVPVEDRVRALRLRAQMSITTQPHQAEEDLHAAQLLARESPEAQQILEGKVA